MKQSEKLRLIKVTQNAISRIGNVHPEIRARANKYGVKFSPTNKTKFREICEIAWCLIATDAKTDAMRLLDALCELDDEYYWMFHHLASAFATRAWLHSKQKNLLLAETMPRLLLAGSSIGIRMQSP